MFHTKNFNMEHSQTIRSVLSEVVFLSALSFNSIWFTKTSQSPSNRQHLNKECTDYVSMYIMYEERNPFHVNTT